MKYIVREISKLIMFTIIWGLPCLIAHTEQDNAYLFLFIMSFFINMQMFGHYDNLERIDIFKEMQDEKKKQSE